ncbi:MAG: hypothetical protein VX075_06170, partial [Pseudomonadota bacterium]|nr:hypothetical protein [Pseudomonadota bacterium]
NIMYGTNGFFGPSSPVTHLLRRNLWIGDTGGGLCVGGGVCTATDMLVLRGSGGRLVVKENYFLGAMSGAVIIRDCGENPGGDDSFFDFQDNMAIGNYGAP